MNNLRSAFNYFWMLGVSIQRNIQIYTNWMLSFQLFLSVSKKILSEKYTLCSIIVVITRAMATLAFISPLLRLSLSVMSQTLKRYHISVKLKLSTENFYFFLDFECLYWLSLISSQSQNCLTCFSHILGGSWRAPHLPEWWRTEDNTQVDHSSELQQLQPQ